jgi:succinate dehydrogenase / fumarate reductase, cytochrome b subunit
MSGIHAAMSSEQKHFLARRIHSLLGVVPLGGFVLFHLFENSRAMAGPRAYDEMVATIGGLPYLRIVEWLALLLPILAHGFYGLYIALQAKRTLSHQVYGRSRTWRFWLQRASGIVLLAFISYHVYSTRLSIAYFGTARDAFGQAVSHPSFTFMSQHLHHAPWVLPLYGLGIASAAWHLANGLWSFAIAWGITVKRSTQDAMLKFVSLPLFVLITAMGWYALSRFKVSAADLPPLPAVSAIQTTDLS